jgi:DNA-3-methyladenine glycosylase
MHIKLPLNFYQQEDVVCLSQKLLGKFLFTMIEGHITGGMIVETEAYRGPEDRASHAYQMRKTTRNAAMYLKGGHAYIYFCYGLHTLFNIVTNQENIPHAILIRAIEPIVGIDTMLHRRQHTKFDHSLTAGPGSLSKALGITIAHNGIELTGPIIWLEDRGHILTSEQIVASPRVGVAYAQEDASLPWRFRVIHNPWTSRAK